MSPRLAFAVTLALGVGVYLLLKAGKKGSNQPAGPGLEHHVLHSAALGWDVGYVVWKPANYDPARKYPVIYFLHGANGTESADAAGFSGWVAKGIEKGMLPPVLVVFPNGGMSGYRGAVEKMIVGELVPLIDRTYPTLARPESRAVVGFSMGGAIAIRYVSVDSGAHVSKLALCGAAAPIWTQRKDFPYNLLKSDVDELIELNYKDRPKLLSNFAKIFSATETSLNEGIGNWLNGIGLSASSRATAQCLMALRDTDLRSDLAKIAIPTLIMHGKKDKICSFDLAEQMKAGITNSHIVAFENSGHSLFLEETQKFNAELIKFAEK